jgi:SAM-dependent methyltransferase
LITNTAYDPGLTEYSQKYEETQGFSPTFSAFQNQQAQSLVERYELRGKDIVEIGCGKGEFLSLLCKLGPNRGTGYDPAYVPERDKGAASGDTVFVRDFYSDKYAGDGADLIVCKMTLEHIHDVGEFLSTIRRLAAIRAGSTVFIQVPDVTRILRDCAFEDVYYEHVSYFSPGSLGRLFNLCGLDVVRTESLYGDQYLVIEGRIAGNPVAGGSPAPIPPQDDIERLRAGSAAFRDAFRDKLALWHDRIREFARPDRRAVIWGSGSKGVAFLTTLGVENEIEYAVDINPFRQGHFMPGTGQKIVPGEFLREYAPDTVVVMNAIYLDEIQEGLDALGVKARLLAI